MSVREATITYYDGSGIDDEGELKLGWFYRLLPDGMEMGPYHTGPDAEAACRLEYE